MRPTKLTAITVCPALPQVEEYLPRTLADLLRDLRTSQHQRQMTVFVGLSVAVQARLQICFNNLIHASTLYLHARTPPILIRSYAHTTYLAAVFGATVPAQPQNPPPGRQAGQRAHLREPNKGMQPPSRAPSTSGCSRLSLPWLAVRFRVLSTTRQRQICHCRLLARHTGYPHAHASAFAPIPFH